MIENFYESGINLILYLQSWGEWLVAPMRLITSLGGEAFFLLFMPIIYWSIDAVLGLRVSIVLLLSSGLNAVLKLAFHSPRPYWVSREVHAYTSESSFGIPSGHAMVAASIWGFIAAQQRRVGTRVFFGALIFLIGFSRVFLGVHFPIDVLLGWIFGIVLLWLFIRLENPVLAWLARQPVSGRLLVASLVSLLLIALGGVTLASMAGWEIPLSWIENAKAAFPDEPPIDPLTLSDVITSAGAFFGLSAGGIWLFAGRGYDAGGGIAARLLRIPLGLIGVILIWAGLGAILPDNADFLSHTLRFVRYSLVGLWISALAPLVFIRLGLAREGTK